MPRHADASSRTIATHDVLNQPSPRVEVDEYALNPALREAVATFAPAGDHRELHDIGAYVGSAWYQDAARLANTITPVLRTHDRWGHRIDEIEFHPAYHAVMEYSCTRRRGPNLGPAPTSPAPPAFISSAKSSPATAVRSR